MENLRTMILLILQEDGIISLHTSFFPILQIFGVPLFAPPLPSWKASCTVQTLVYRKDARSDGATSDPSYEKGGKELVQGARLILYLLFSLTRRWRFATRIT